MTGTGEPRKRRRGWWALAIFPLLLVAAVLLVALSPYIVTGERIRSEAVSALTELLGVPVQIGHVEYRPFSGVSIDRVVIGPPPGFSEDVLTIEHAGVDYRLGGIFGRRVVVESIRVVAPVITLETHDGVRNLDVILARLGSGEPESRALDAESGPLTPIDVDLEALEIGPVTVRIAGEGPNATLAGAKLALHGHLGRSRLEAALDLSLVPDGADNVTATLAENTVGARARLLLQVRAAGSTAHGLALEEGDVHLEAENLVTASWEGTALDPATLSLALDLSLRPGRDQAKVGQAVVKLDDQTLLSASANLDGLSALFGAELAAALGPAVGLVANRSAGTVRVKIDQASAPLDRLEPWARLVLPELRMGGTVTVARFEVAGTPGQVVAGTPAELSVGLSFDGVRCELPSAKLALGDLGGALSAKRREQGDYALEGRLELAGVRQARNRIERAVIDLSASAEALRYPSTGPTEMHAAVAITGAALPPARVPSASIDVGLSGVDPLDDARAGAPIRVRVGASVGSARIAGTATSTLDLGGVKVALDAALDRLIAPATTPIQAGLALSVGRARLGSRSIERASVDVDARLGDPRDGHFDADARVLLKVKRAIAAPARVEDAAVRLTLAAEDVRAREVPRFPGAVPPMMPKRVALRLSVTAPSVALSDRKLGDVATPIAFETSLSADPITATVNVDKLSLAIEDVLTVGMKGRASRLYGAAPYVDGELSVGPVHLDALAKKLPRGLIAEIPDLRADGKVQLSVIAKGVVPQRFEETSLVRQPITGRVRVVLDGVGASSRRRSIRLSGLSGTIVADVGDGKVETQTELDAAEIEEGRAPLQSRVEKLTVRNHVRLQEDVWSVASHIRAASVRSAYGGEGAVEGAAIDLDLTYPLHGDLDVSRFAVHAPGNGVELLVSGRLRRRSFGVLRPDLSLSAHLDLDCLRHLLPQLSGGSGKAALALEVRSKSDRIVDVEGRLETDRFSWEVPKVLTVLNASGRIPLTQRLLLPAPALDDTVARSVGALGDDFEARALELLADLGNGKALLQTEDILVEAPRSADYQSLRPFYAESGARLTIEGVVYKQHALEDVTLEGLWSSGVLRVDRLACRLWEGDLLGDLAVQFTSDQNVRMRLRGTITDLNMDIPYAMANGIEPVSDPKEKEDFRISGQMDLEFALKQRAVNARVDVTKLSLPLVRRVFAALRLSDSRALDALEMAQYVGVRPQSGKVSISNNLLTVNFDWERLWVHMSLNQETFWLKLLDGVLVVARWALIPTAGGYVIKTVNETIRNFSISAVLDDLIGQARVEDELRFLEGRVIAADRVPGGASGLQNEASADMLSPR